MSEISIVRASQEHARFIATATLNAERANLGKGMWDTFFDIGGAVSEEDAQSCLEAVIADSDRFPETHIALANFFLAVKTKDGEPVGSCSIYGEPFSVPNTWKALNKVTKERLSWDEDMFQLGYNRLACMQDVSAWPALVSLTFKWLFYWYLILIELLSCALDSPDLKLSYPITSQSQHITTILISLPQTLKSFKS